MIVEGAIQARYQAIAPVVDERVRRLVLAAEASAAGRGGQAAVNHRIQVFDGDGEFQAIWTDIQRPMDISQDKDGILYVSEGSRDDSPSRFSVLDKQGNVLGRFNCRGGHGSWVDSHGDDLCGHANQR